MRRLIFVVAVVMLLIIGGGLTAQIASNDGTLSLPGVIRQTTNPDASALDMVPWKAEQLFLLIGFVLFNLIGIALTITVIMWFLNRQVRRANAQPRKDAGSVTVPLEQP